VTPRVIGLTGIARSGKSTVAQHLVEKHGFVRVAFGEPMKAMLRALGLSDEELYGARKELPCALLGGQLPRVGLQTLGTEWAENYISPDLWSIRWERTACDVLDHGGRVVADDLRRAQDVRSVKSVGGAVIGLSRKASVGAVADHVTERRRLPVDQDIANDFDTVQPLLRIFDLYLAGK
jgi:hypothetical protein